MSDYVLTPLVEAEKYATTHHGLSKHKPLTREKELKSYSSNLTLHQACEKGQLDKVKDILSRDLEDINCQGTHGRTPVMVASSKGHLEVFDYLVRQGCDLSLRDQNNDTVLHMACYAGNIDIARKLITELKHDVDEIGGFGMTPVMVAAENGHKEVIKFLVDKSCDVTLAANNGNNILHIACCNGHLDIAEYTVKLVNIDSRGMYGRTAVLMAAENGYKEIVKLLIREGCNPTLVDYYSNTIFHVVCSSDKVDVAKYLITQNIVCKDCKYQLGRTPLLIAAWFGSIRVFDVLVIEGYSVSAVDAEGSSVLHVACLGGHLDMVKHIIKNYNVDIESRGFQGRTPLLITAVMAYKAIFDFLIRKGCNAKAVDDNKNTILHVACLGGHLDMVKHVIKNSIIDIESKGFGGRTPLLTAAVTGHKAIFDFLIRKGCNAKTVDDNKNTILQVACLGGHKDMVKHIIKNSIVDIESRGFQGRTPLLTTAGTVHKAIFDFLIRKGCNAKTVDDNKNTILHVACLGGHLDMVKHIIKNYNVDIESRGFHGRTPLLTAAVMAHKAIFDFLIRKGCNAKTVDDNKNAILHVVCLGGHTDMVKHVIENSCVDIDSKGFGGRTPLMMAAHMAHTEIFNFLVRKGGNVKAVDENKHNMLHMACLGGNVGMVKFIINQDIINIEGRALEGRTPLLTVAAMGSESLFYLLEKKGCNLKAVDDKNNNILHLACCGGNVRLVRYIITKHLFDIDCHDAFGMTPVLSAAHFGHTEVVEFLNGKGCNMSAKDVHGNNIMHVACFSGKTDFVRYLFRLQIVSVHDRNKRGQTSLDVAKALKYNELVHVMKGN